MQFRDFLIELLRQEVDNVFVGLKARMTGTWPSGKTKRSSEVDVDDFQAFKALQASKVEVVRRAVHNLCVFAHHGTGVPVAMHMTVSEGVHFQVSAAATASGLAPRRLLVERTEVPEQPITTYRTCEKCLPVLRLVPWLFLALLSSLHTG